MSEKEHRVVHCWEGEEEHVSEEERQRAWGLEYAGEPVRPWGICMLPDGHAGPHMWTDPGDLSVRFKPEAGQ